MNSIFKSFWQAHLKLVAAVFMGLSILCATVTGFQPLFSQKSERFFLDRNISAVCLNMPERKAVLILGSDIEVQRFGSWPISRSIHAQLLNNSLSGAGTIVIDMLFSEKSNEQADLQLAEAIKGHGNVVLISRYNNDLMDLYPCDIFEQGAVAVGFANSPADFDNVHREMVLFKKHETVLIPSVTLATLLTSGYGLEKIEGDNVFLKDSNGNKLVLDNNYYRIPFPNNKLEIYSYSDVYDGKIPESAFDGAIVYIGASVTGAPDVVYGVEGIASATKYLTDSYITAAGGFSPYRIPVAAQIAVVILLLLLTGIICIRFSFKSNWIFPLLFSVIWILAARLLFVNNICYVYTFYPIAASFTAYFTTLFIGILFIMKDLRIRSMPVESLFELTKNLLEINEDSEFGTFLQQSNDNIRKVFNAEIIHAIISENNSTYIDLMNKIPQDKRKPEALTLIRGDYIAGYKNIVIVPLPVFVAESGTGMYSVVASKGSLSLNSAQSISALIISTYIYFLAAKDSVQKQKMYYTIIGFIITVIDAKDPITSGHSKRVAQIASQIASNMSLDKKTRKDIEFAAIIHDIGKIGIPDSVLHKESIFTKGDFEIMKIHPLSGSEMVRTAGFSEEIVNGVLQHHERPDGKGYPYGIKDDELGLFGKIIKVADVFDALVSNRQYKKAWSVKKAVDILEKGKGTEFDSEIVDIFLTNLDKSEYSSSDSVVSETDIKDKGYCFLRSITDKTPDMINRAENLTDKELKYSFTDNFSFCGIDWGESYNLGSFLSKCPHIADFDAQTNSITFIFSGNYEAFDNICLYFYRGFLSLGIYIAKSDKTAELLKELSNEFGVPCENDGYIVWDRQNIFVYYIEDENGMGYAAYLTKYLIGNI